MMYKLYANVVIVIGFSRASLCDLQRNKIYIISKQLAKKIKRNVIDSSVIDKSFLEFLIENDLIFEIANKAEAKLFPPINFFWDAPREIDNAIIDLDSTSIVNLQHYIAFFYKLDKVRCRVINFRFFDQIETEVLEKIFVNINSLDFSMVNILLKYNFENVQYLSRIINSENVAAITIHSCPSKIEKINSNKISYVDLNVNSELCCGVIRDSYFAININHYSEAQQHNTCLNRKISVDTQGNIKNCPSMKKSFGNIDKSTINEILEEKDFRELWYINKDMINKCQDCEFRYICTDCRAYMEDPNNLYSKPLKCGYDPVTCKWEPWSKNPAKKEAIKYYNILV